MNQQTMNNECSCNDYIMLGANTGIGIINTANPYLDGSGSTTSIFTAGLNGSIIKSVTIKAITPTNNGMVRLFLQNADASVIALYKEVQIPQMPVLQSTPTPVGTLPMYKITLTDNYKLASGWSIVASTQNNEIYNVIVEGLDWKYPRTLPDSCCSYMQLIANTGIGIVSTGNAKLDGTGTMTSLLTGGNDGTTIKSITIKALQNTIFGGMIRLFINVEEVNYLYKEIQIPESVNSATQPSLNICLDGDDFKLMNGASLLASTQYDQNFAITVDAEDWKYAIS